MASLTHLNALLSGALHAGHAPDEQAVFDLLLTHRPALLRILDVGPQSDAERKELQSGKITIDTRQIAINADFATQATFLGGALECSERHTAGLMQAVITRAPNLATPGILEHSILEHHARRRATVECLQLLLDCAARAEQPEHTPLLVQLAQFVQTQLVPGLGAKVWAEVEKMEQVVARAQTAVQNAGSNTEVQGTNMKVGQDCLSARLQSLLHERRELMVCLFLVARLGRLSPTEIEKMVPWLQQSPKHPLTYYVLATLLAFFDVVDPSSPASVTRQKLSTTPGILNLMKTRLSPGSEWKEPGLKAALLLKWTLFLAELRRRDATLEHKDGFQTEQLEINVWNAVQGDAFAYLSAVLVRLQLSEDTPVVPIAGVTASDNDPSTPLPEMPADDFKPAILQALETLARLTITHASSELRKIKQRQEDHMFAASRSDRARTFRAVSQPAPKPNAPPPRNDIATFFAFLGLLYTALPPERALQFWGSVPQHAALSHAEAQEAGAGKLPGFLQWAVWSTQAKDADAAAALFALLAGLAKGEQCAELAYNFLARGTGEVVPGNAMPSGYAKQETVASWAFVFRLLEAWATPVSAARAPPPQPQGGFMSSQAPQPPQPQFQQLGAKDVYLGQSLLRLLATVAQHAEGPRGALTSNTHLHAVQTLTALLPLNCALELKAAAFAALAALAAPPGVEVPSAVWVALERLEIINVRGGGPMMKKGVQAGLEIVEEPNRVYPQTLAFLGLLAALVHAPKQLSLRSRVSGDANFESIPAGLGAPYRAPGAAPYVAFVVDDVFLRIPGREYAAPRDRWRMNDGCLAFLEKCLASFDLEELLAEPGPLLPQALLEFLEHPGYLVLQLFLSRSALLSNVLSYAVDGVDGFDRGLDKTEPFFARTIVRVLRILVRVLELQQPFLDVFVPFLVNLRNAHPGEARLSSIPGGIHPRNHYVPLDAALSFGSSYPPALAAYITHAPGHPELALLSVKILAALARSAAFPAHNLTTLLERSTESVRIVDGYRALLAAGGEPYVAPDEALEVADARTGAGAPMSGFSADESQAVRQAVRVAALDLLAENAAPGAPFPNVAHFLLLGSTAQPGIQDPRALGATKAAVHVILEHLGAGVPSRGTKVGHERAREEMLLSAQPELAERMYTIVHNLCVHPRTAESTTRYLRTHEDFFARQLAAAPIRAPSAPSPGVEVQYADGARVATVVARLAAFLRARATICNLAALDAHALAARGHGKALGALLGVFFGSEEEDADAPGDWEDEVFGTRRAGTGAGAGGGGQSSMRAIELLQSLAFDWVNGLAVEPQALALLADLDIGACTAVDAHGCALVDRAALVALLAAARRSGRVQSEADAAALGAEQAYVLQSAVVENQRRAVAHAQAAGVAAWAALLGTALAHLPPDAGAHEVLLADVLHELPPLLRAGALADGTAVLLAESALALVGRLKSEAAPGHGALSRERMLGTLRALVDCALENRAEVVRGNVYATLVNYLQLVAAPPPPPAADGTSLPALASTSTTEPFSQSLALSTLRASTLAVSKFGTSTLGKSALGKSQSSSNYGALVRTQTSDGALATLRPVLERLVVTVARDAAAGVEVWRTVAFTLLARLVPLDGSNAVLNILHKHGFLQGFVHALAETDARLISVLKPDPDDLNALYVYEAQMALLMSAAATRTGAERLLDARLLPTLAKCEFLDAQPAADHAFVDRDAFLPSAVQRYHQLLLPALQLATQLHATLAPHATATAQALAFLSEHAETFVILLKSELESLSALAEARLIVMLGMAVLPGVEGREKMAEHTGFGGMHAAILALAARALSGRLAEAVVPQTELESIDNSVLAPGYAQKSKFELAARDAEWALSGTLLSYLAAASNFGEDSASGVTLVVAPVFGAARATDSRVVATVPTMGDLFDTLGNLSSELADTLRIATNLSAELSARVHLRIEDYIPILPAPLAALSTTLSPNQTRELIAEELERIRKQVVSRAEGLLMALEVALLVAWVHAGVYADEDGAGKKGVQVGSAALGRSMAGAPRGEGFAHEAARRAGPALARVDGLALDAETGWRDRAAYVEVVGARIREVLQLGVDEQQ